MPEKLTLYRAMKKERCVGCTLLIKIGGWHEMRDDKVMCEDCARERYDAECESEPERQAETRPKKRRKNAVPV